MKINTPKPQIRTHEGAVAKHINPEQQLRRSVMSCMLWEDEFYESGESIAKRIADTIKLVDPVVVTRIAIEARTKMKLRHVPLMIVREMARLPKHKGAVAIALREVIQRPDELTEFCAIWQKDQGGKPLSKTLSAQAKKGLAQAFSKFSEYSLSKWNKDRAIKLRDVLFLCHAKPNGSEQAALWKRLINGELKTPDTWEVELSASADKLASWTRLLTEKKLGGLALLRNLRNMQQASVPDSLIREALSAMKTERVLPFRFIAAARHAPQLEPDLEQAMFRCLTEAPKLKGKTILMVDVSGSMDAPMSGKSDLQRIDAACGLAMLLREVCEEVNIVTFSNCLVQVPPRRGFALRDAVLQSQPHSGTALGQAVLGMMGTPHDRLIVISDEQSRDPVPDPVKSRCAYMVNVASAKNGVGYGPWLHVDGFSEAIVDYIAAHEAPPQ